MLMSEWLSWSRELVLWNTLVVRKDTASALCTRSWSHLSIFVFDCGLSRVILWFGFCLRCCRLSLCDGDEKSALVQHHFI